MPEGAQGRTQITGQGTHIDALTGLHLEDGEIRRRAIKQLEPGNVHSSRSKLHWLVGASESIGAFAGHFDRRVSGWDLLDISLEAIEQRDDLVGGRTPITGRDDLTVSIIGVSLLSPANREPVDLAAFHNVADGLGRFAERQRQREGLVQAASEMLADLLIDVAACRLLVPEQQIDDRDESLERLKRLVREREQQCVNALLDLFRFDDADYAADALPISDGKWGSDLFSPASLREFGIRAGSGAAAGAAAGLAIDALAGGLTLGAAAALGATLGALWSSLGSHGRRLVDVFQGFTELRVADETLRLLAARQLDLVAALLRRGHASQDKLRLNSEAEAARSPWIAAPLPDEIAEARHHPEWSRLDGNDAGGGASVADRTETRDRLARRIAQIAGAPPLTPARV